MIIIKSNAISVDILNIADAMYKFELGVEYPPLINGEYMDYKLKMNRGYIFVGKNMNVKKLISRLVRALDKRDHNNDTREYVRTRISTNITCIKMERRLIYNFADSGIERIGNNRPDNSYGITWFIQKIDSFSFGFASDRLLSSIEMHVLSIFYDCDNVCTLGHGMWVNELKREHFWKVIKWVDDHVTLCDNGPVLLREIYGHELSLSLRRVSEEKIYWCEWNDLVSKYGAILENCSWCKKKLYGENYVLAYPIMRLPKGGQYSVICPLCFHINNAGEMSRIENNYMRVLRVQFPCSYAMWINDKVSLGDLSEVKADIFSEALVGITYDNVLINGVVTKCMLIGSKYIGIIDRVIKFDEKITYNGLELSSTPRMFCNVYIVHFN